MWGAVLHRSRVYACLLGQIGFVSLQLVFTLHRMLTTCKQTYYITTRRNAPSSEKRRFGSIKPKTCKNFQPIAYSMLWARAQRNMIRCLRCSWNDTLDVYPFQHLQLPHQATSILANVEHSKVIQVGRRCSKMFWKVRSERSRDHVGNRRGIDCLTYYRHELFDASNNLDINWEHYHFQHGTLNIQTWSLLLWLGFHTGPPQDFAAGVREVTHFLPREQTHIFTRWFPNGKLYNCYACVCGIFLPITRWQRRPNLAMGPGTVLGRPSIIRYNRDLYMGFI